MSRQDRGLTPNLERLCRNLDDELQKLLDDLKVYLYPEKKSVGNKLIFSYEEEDDSRQVYSDRVDIEQHLRGVSDSHIRR